MSLYDKEVRAMLLEFACSNHKSIGEEIVFSALAGKDSAHLEKTFEFGSYNVLKSAVIYGANGSGKSNFINAIAFVKNLVSNSISHQPGQGILQTPHKLCGTNNSSTYKIQFIKDQVRYAYGFSISNYLVSEEYLYYFPNNRQVKIFERSAEEFETGSKFRGRLNNCKDILKPNRLLLSCAANFSSVDEIEKAYRFFVDDLVIYNASNESNWMDYSLHQIHSNPQIKAAVLAFMRDLGLGIKDINIKIDKKSVQDIEIPPFLSDEFKSQILQGTVDAISAKVVYDGFDTDLMSEESTGIQKLFAFLCPLLDIIVNGKVLICDELETNLHEALVYGLIRLFINVRTDEFAQIFFTTHDTSLLTLDLFRRDQIWFTELSNDNRSTKLYSLAEIKNVRKDESVGKGYIAGKYGAIPMLNIDFANIVANM